MAVKCYTRSRPTLLICVCLFALLAVAGTVQGAAVQEQEERVDRSSSSSSSSRSSGPPEEHEPTFRVISRTLRDLPASELKEIKEELMKDGLMEEAKLDEIVNSLVEPGLYAVNCPVCVVCIIEYILTKIGV